MMRQITLRPTLAYPIRSLILVAFCLPPLQSAEESNSFHAVRGRLPTPFVSGRFEGERLVMQGKSRPQEMAYFGNSWSGNGQLLWDGELQQSLETSFELDDAGRYSITLQLTKAPDYGTFAFLLNGERYGELIDLYSSKVTLAAPIRFENIALPAGSQSLSFQLVKANSSATAVLGRLHLMGIDYIDVRRLDSPTTPVTDLPTDTANPQSPVRSIDNSRGQSASINLPTTHVDNEVSPLSSEALNGAMTEYCGNCHANGESEGNFSLNQILSQRQRHQNIGDTKRALDVLRRNTMPPPEALQPPQDLRRHMISTFASSFQGYMAEHPPSSAVVMRRMNRYEFSNAVRDLLNLKGDIYPLPEKTIRADAPYFDPASGHFPRSITIGNRTLGKNQIEQHILTGVSPFAIDLQAEGGFNNRGSQLSISPILLESFLKLGRSIVFAPEFDSYCNHDQLFQVPPTSSHTARCEIANQRISDLLERAFRGPIEEKTATRYHTFFEQQLSESGSFSSSMKNVVAAILASPRFIYLPESSGSDRQLSAWELATRLSFFLWSSLPDEALMSCARDGSLMQADVLDAQVDRMLEDPRSQALSQNFARQWMRLDQLIAAVPDFDRFEEYYSRIGCEQWKLGLQSMLEPLLLFESIMVEDRSIMLLIDSNYTYRSKELQSWYHDKIPFAGRENRDRFNTNQQQFRRVTLDDRRQGGIITTAATLTMTSAPLRTSPITRGAWVATVVFNQPPPPPPDDVPAIEADERVLESRGVTLRQRLVEHQTNQSCISCHAKIDPLGFALENFDAVGRWRDQYSSGLAIDASGKLMGGKQFNNIQQLKDILLENPEWFIRAFSEHMLSYAIGRKLELTDESAVDQIVHRAVAHRGQFTSIVREIVHSPPFRGYSFTNQNNEELK